MLHILYIWKLSMSLVYEDYEHIMRFNIANNDVLINIYFPCMGNSCVTLL